MNTKRINAIIIIIIFFILLGFSIFLVIKFDVKNSSNWMVAIATVILGIIAIFQDWIKSKFWKTKIRLESINFTNDNKFPHITHNNNKKRLLFFHFKIINEGRFEAKNISIRINKIISYKGDGTNNYNDYQKDKVIVLDVPCSLSDDNKTPFSINIKNYEVKVFLTLAELSRPDDLDEIEMRYYFILYNYVRELMDGSFGFDLFLEITGDNNYINEDYYIKIRFITDPLFIKLDQDIVKNNFMIELIDRRKKN